MKTYKSWIRLVFLCLILITNQRAFSADYYWVGDGGNWSDTLHWATTSGGATYYSVPPTQDDNVYFDANSFTLTGQVVNINANADCKDFDWTGATNTPDLAGASDLNVYGSIKLVSGMTASFTGNIVLWSDDAGNTLDFAGVTLNVLVFDIWGFGEWTLTSDLNISGDADLRIWSGATNTGNYNINVHRFWIYNYYGDEVYLNLGASTINIDDFRMYYPSLTHINAGTSVINLTEDSFYGEGMEYYDVNLKSSGGLRDYEVSDSNTFHTLTFEDAASVTFPAGLTTKVDSIAMNGTCAQNVTVQSDNSGSKAYIYKESGTVVNDYLSIKDMEITGGATFTANYSINLANVANWVINEPVSSTDYYWVGGTGNWTDTSHWATTSGGAGNGTCIPSSNDNVFFDANSFTAASQTVTMDLEAAFKSMDWTGVTNNPTFQATTYNLHAGGSLVFAPSTDMSVSINQNIYFSSDSAGNSINMNGHTCSSATFNFSGSGEWDILSDLALWSIYFNGGTFNSNDHQISLNSKFGSGATSVRNVNLGSSLVTTKDLYFTNSTNLNIDASAATIQVSGSILYTGFQDYHTLSLTGSTSVNIYGDVSIDSLYINPGLTVALEAGITLAVDKISATGTCSNLTVIESQTPGSEATITTSSDTLVVEYVQMQDIHATGEAVFINYNGVDNGNNDGWAIDYLTSTTYYWVGNSGNWSDPNHWALSSNGPGNGGCIPNYNDDVVFDEYSFTGGVNLVTLDQDAYCRNMDWSQVTGTGNLYGTFNLYIYGSFDISNVNSYSVSDKLYFMSDEMGNTINTGGKTLNQVVYFLGSGEWTLQSDMTLSVSRDLRFNNGTLHTNNNNITSLRFYSDSSNTKYLDLGSSVINCTGWLITDGTHMTIEPGTSEININSPSFYGGALNYYNVINTIGQSATIYDSGNTFHTLALPNASGLYLQAEGTQTIDSLVIPEGTGCNDLFSIGKAGLGGPATLSIPSGSLTVNYCNISNVIATGGATFSANNSIGSGDVTGWDFPISAIDIGNDTSFCEGDSVLLDAGAGNTYVWSTGATTQTIYALITDTYSVTVTSSCGYSNGEINVTEIPVTGATDVITVCESYTWIDGITYTESNNTATDTLTNINGCDSIVTLDLTILKSSTGIDVISACESYTWIDGVTYTESNNTATYTLTNAVGCDSVVTLDLTILEPSTGIDVISACESYTWIDGITYTESNNTATDTLTNIYGCDSVVTLNLTIIEPHSILSEVELCSGSDYTYPDGTTQTNITVNFTHVSNLVSEVTGCDSIITTNVTVMPLPVVNLSEDDTICTGSNLVLDAGVSEMTYAWSDQGQNTQTILVHPGTTTTYSVTVTNENGCSNSDEIVVNVEGSSANYSFTVNEANNTVNFTNLSTGADTYYWNFGDGETSTEQNPTHVYENTGIFTVSLIAKSASGECMDETVQDVQLGSDGCNANFSYYVSNLDNQVHFTNEQIGNATEFTWEFGDGAVAYQPNPIHRYGNTGIYTVTLHTYNKNSECMDESTKNIIVGEPGSDCQAGFLFTVDGKTVSFKDNSIGKEISHYTWDFNDGSVAYTQSPVHEFGISGVYNVCLTIEDNANNCSNTICKRVKVNNGDAAIEIADFNYTVDSLTKTVYFKDNSISSCEERKWDFMANDPSNQGGFSTELNPQYTYANAGLYRIKMELGGNCKGKVYKYININESNPGFQVYFDHEENESILKSTSYPVHFTGISNGIPASFEWNFGDGNTNNTSSTPRHSYSSKGEYEVCLTIKDPNLGQEATYCEIIKVGFTTGVNELENPIGINVYPNPVHDHLVVELPSTGYRTIEILDITGKLVLTQPIEGKEVVIENLNFETGTYFLRIFGKRQTINTYLLIKN